MERKPLTELEREIWIMTYAAYAGCHCPGIYGIERADRAVEEFRFYAGSKDKPVRHPEESSYFWEILREDDHE